MGAVSSPTNSSDNASGASLYAALHSTSQSSHRPAPQDRAVLSVQAIQFGETNALAGHSFSTTPLAAASAAQAAESTARAAAASATAPIRDSTPRQTMAQPPSDAIRALYSNQTKAPPVFSVLA